MRTYKVLSLAMSCVLSFSAIPASVSAQAADGTGQDTGTQYLTRTLISEENGLRHFSYTNEDGDAVTLDAGEKVTLNRKKAASLPSSYNSVSAGKVTPIKDQGETGTCWAFGAIKALESSAISKALSSVNNTDLSENHLAWYSYTAETDSGSSVYGDAYQVLDSRENVYMQGGDAVMAISTLANWWGAADEASAPFDTSNGGSTNMVKTMSNADDSLRYRSVIHLKEANCYDDADIANVKQAIIDYGAVNASLYYPETQSDYLKMISKNGNDYSMYQNRHSGNDANHSITIVGWDDSYSSFASSPKGNGAWLIANSYGTDDKYSNNGYYWVSYYDTSLCEFYSFEADSPDQYDTNYQYDGAGYSGAITHSADAAAANIFTNTNSTPQKIEAVSFYTLADNQDYEVHVYRNVTGTTPDSGEYVAEAATEGTMSYQGFHTVTLKNPVSVSANEKFSVVVIYRTSGSYTYVPVEGDEDSLQVAIDRRRTIEYKKVSSKAGQSFIYSVEDGWNDTTKFPNTETSFLRYFQSTVKNYNNVCIKAYGSNLTDEEYQTSQAAYVSGSKTAEELITKESAAGTTKNQETSSTQKDSDGTGDSSEQKSDSASSDDAEKITITPLVSSMTIGKGEKVALSYELSDSDEPAFKSSNTSVAQVNSSGTVTGKKAGKAKITITTSTGNKGTVTIIVKKAPTKVSVSASKTTLKKGKTVKLKVKVKSGYASYRITYQSSNKKIASVSKKGVVTAKKKGTVKITVTTFNKKKATIKIRVK